MENSMSYQPHNMLVTGGAGFIGCNFIRYMLETYPDVTIVNLDKLTYAGSLDNIADYMDDDRHKFVEGDICDRSLVDKLLRGNKIDTIVHFAAESHVDNSISDPGVFIQTNIVGTFTLLEASRLYWLEEQKKAINDCRFHHISTDEVYGMLGQNDPAFTEETPYAPNSPYSASKAGSDHLVRAYFHTYKLPVTTTNCSNNYGPFQHNEKFIPTIIRSCVKQEPIPVYGDGSNIRDWLYVEDHCSGINAVIHNGRPGDVYNIGGANEWSNIDIVRLICKLMDDINISNKPHDNLISFVPDRPGHDWRYAIDAQKMEAEIKWKPENTFESGIGETLKWYIDNICT
jgi:dTDP-glucose 4,6-dehydratase